MVMEEKGKKNRKDIGEYGVIFLYGGINEATAQAVCEEIIRINLEGESDSIQIIINSPGGFCSAGFAIIDMMEWSRLPVYTLGIGLIASMSLAIFMAGEKGNRVLTPRTSILSHRFSAFSFGNHAELLAKRKEEDWMHRRLLDHYIRHTNLRTDKQVQENLLRDVDTWLTYQEALKLGIADIVQEDWRVKKMKEAG